MVFSVQASHVVSEVASLGCAAGGGVFGVEVEDDGLSLVEILLQVVRVAVLVKGFKGRRIIAGAELDGIAHGLRSGARH